MTNAKNSTSNISSRLLQGSAIIALSVFSTTVAFGQAAAPASVETVEVTGTIIRGAGPTGSELITVGRAQIEDIGAVTIQNILSDVPGLNNFGGSGQVGVNSSDPAGASSPTIHSLGNSASNGTLILVDGHRLPYTGNGHSTIDPGSIPVVALQQVQVLPDGASSTYGSDAVAGVLNFITRKNFTGIEGDAQYGFADHYESFNAGAVFGHDWDGGSAFVALDYSSKSQLANGVRSYETPRQDLRLGALANPTAIYPAISLTPPTGFVATTPAAGTGTTGPYGVTIPYPSYGSNFDGFSCPIATIKANSSATTSFLYPYNGAAIANNVTSFNGVCSEANSGTDLPSDTRNTIFFSFKQNLTNNLTLNVDFDYSYRINGSNGNYGSITAIAYGPTSAKGTPVTYSATTGLPATTLTTGNQINPFYVGNATTGTSSEYVSYDFTQLDQLNGIPVPLSKTFDETGYLTFGLDYDLGGDWEATLGGTGGTDFSGARSINSTCAACAELALNGSTNTTGLQNNGIDPGTAATATTYNGSAITDPQGLGSYAAQTRQLTTLNALDVWDPAASNKTSLAVLKQISSGYSLSTGQQALQDVSLKFDGPVFDLTGAGPVKVAVGGEYTQNEMTAEVNSAQSGIGPSAVANVTQNLYYGRQNYAAYAEILVPIVSPEMNIPLMQKLDGDISGRYDSYTFYGDTENPKLGFTWGMIDGLQSRGSFGTSFTVPAFNSSGRNGNGITSQSNAGTTTSVPVPTGVASNTVAFNSTLPYNGGAGIAGTWITTAAGCAAAGSNPVNAAGTSVLATDPTAVGCKLSSATFGLSIGGGGGDPYSNIKPEIGRSYSFGMDFDMGKLINSALDGLAGEVTYYQATYRGLITNINITTSNLGLTTFAPPGGWAPTNPIVIHALGQEPLNSTLPATLWFYTDGGQNNAYNLWTNGLDYNVHYNFDTSIGHWAAGLSGNEVLRFTQQNIGANSLFTDLNGDAASAGRFPAQQMTLRATLNWSMDAFRAGLGFNFQSPYRASNSSFPNTLASPSAPAGTQKIQALQTFDLNAGYTIPEGWYKGLEGTQVNLSISNILDTNPPFSDSASGFTGGSEIGRLVTIALKKNF